MITLKDVRPDDENAADYDYSLNKLLGKKVKDIYWYPGVLGVWVCKLTKVIFEDDTYMWIEGEHDFPYLTGKHPNLDEEVMLALYKEENPEE